MTLADISHNVHLAKAIELRKRFAEDAAARDKAGGLPADQVRWLKASGLLNLVIPAAYGGAGQPFSTAFRVVREFAKTDGSLAHLFGYHCMQVHAPYMVGTEEEASAAYRRIVSEGQFWGNASNLLAHTLTGRRVGEAHVLNGSQPFTSGSHVADALMIAWTDVDSGDLLFANIPGDRAGMVINNDWDGIGQTQTGSGSVTFKDVRIALEEVITPIMDRAPFRTLGGLIQQSVLLNVFIGSAEGALEEARTYTMTKSRPWLHSGVERHVDDPWIRRAYGELFIKQRAATAMADRALAAFDKAWAKGRDLDVEQRGRTAIAVGSANVFAGEIALEVTSKIFDLMGARSATQKNGFDRWWRNVRIHTLHNPAEYKSRNVGYWFLTGEYPALVTYQ